MAVRRAAPLPAPRYLPAPAAQGRATDAPGARGNDAPAGRAAGPGGGRGGGRGGPQGLHVVAPDGVLHILGETSGLDVQKPIPFLPAGAQPGGLSVVDGVAYALTSNGCGGLASGVRAVPLTGELRTVTSWDARGIPVGVPAFGTDGTVYVSIGVAAKGAPDGLFNAVVALEPRTLQMKGWFTPPTGTIASGPTVMRQNDRDLVAVTTSEGRIAVLDPAALGVRGGRALLALSEALGATTSPRGLSSHVDTSGTRWLLLAVGERPAASTPARAAPTAGAVLAFTMENASTLRRAWISTDLISPLAPVIVNGVVFALSSGRTGGGVSSPAVLHAIDPATGEGLWNSGRSIAGSVQGGTMLVGNSQVYVATTDRVVYAFGFAMDRAIK